jgi:hypothetical protein
MNITEYLAHEARKYGQQNAIVSPGDIVMSNFGTKDILRRVKIVNVYVNLIARFLGVYNKEKGLFDNPEWVLDFSMAYCGQRFKKDCYARPDGLHIWLHLPKGAGVGLGLPFVCPLGVPGDRLWVRETFWIHRGGSLKNPDTRVVYDASVLPFQREPDRWLPAWYKKTPSIHMPRWASRITLEITAVRVERLQDISKDEARAEGIQYNQNLTAYVVGEIKGGEPLCVFARLWDTIYAKQPGHSWAANPWVWVITFERVAV